MGTRASTQDLVEIRWTTAPPDGMVKVNGLPVHPKGGETRREAAIRQVARIAARGGGKVEVLEVIPDHPDRRLVITDDGTEHEVSAKAVSSVAADDSGRSAASWRPQSSPRRGEKQAARPSRHRKARKINGTYVLIASAAGLLVLALLSVLYLFREHPGQGEAVAVPLSYASTPKWKTDPLDRALRAVVIPQGIAVVDAGSRLTALKGTDGQEIWSAPFPAGEVSEGLALLEVDGEQALVAHVDDQLHWWSVSTGEAHTVELTRRAKLFVHGAGAVAVMPDGQAGYIKDGALAQVQLPAGATPVSARGDGTLVAVSASGWYRLEPGKKASAANPFTPPTAAEKGGPRIVGYLADGGGQLITVWPAADTKSHPRLVVYSETSTGFPIAFTANLAATSAQEQTWIWRPSPSGYWGTIDRYLVDVRAGRVVDLGDVTVLQIINDRARAALVEPSVEANAEPSARSILVGPSLSSGYMLPGEPLPEAVTQDGAYVRDPQTSTLALLPPIG